MNKLACALLVALAAGCYEGPSAGSLDASSLGETSQDIDLTKCDPAITCPTPKDCGRNWNDKGRDPAWGDCAPPPAGGCTQVVFGRFNDMKKYLGCPGYVTLNLKDWTQKKNDEFVACAASGQLGATCSPEILIA